MESPVLPMFRKGEGPLGGKPPRSSRPGGEALRGLPPTPRRGSAPDPDRAPLPPRGSLAPLVVLMALVLALGGCGGKPGPDLGAVEGRVRRVLSLPTYELWYQDLAYVGMEDRLFDLFTTLDKRTLFSVRIRVQAGFDLARGFRLEPVPAPENAPGPRGLEALVNPGPPWVLIHLPPPDILLVDVDETSFHEYFSVEYGGELTLSDWETPLAKSRERVRQDALDRGILDQARQNGEALVRNLVELAGLSVAGVVYAEEAQP